MSGGSYNYTFEKVEYQYSGRMFDEELNNMIKDLCQVLKDLEWWKSGDISEDQYRETARAFKDKWFGNRPEIIIEAATKLLNEAIHEINKL